MTSRLPSYRLFTWLVLIGLSICAVANAGEMSPVRVVVDEPSPDHVLISIEIPTPTRDVVRTVQGIQDHWRIVGEQSLAIPGQPDVPVISRLVQVSESGWVEANILNIDEEVIPASPQGPVRVPVDEEAGDVEVRDSGDSSPNWTVRLSEPGIMGGIRITNLSIVPVRYDPEDNVYHVVRRIQLSVDNVGGRAPNSIERTRPISPAFAEMAQSMILNWRDSEPVYHGDLRGRYLIIAGELLLSQMEPFAAWKQQKGYEVLLVGKSAAGNSNTNIRNYIQSVYESEGPPLSYVLLVGDCDGTQGIPEFTIESPSHGEIDATDHPYSLLEGEDYFPDIFVGRLSTNTIDKVRVMVSKTVKYEKTPYTGQTDWFRSATVVAGNYAEGITPLTPVWTSMWIQEKFQDYGFIRVDTLFYRGPPGPSVIEILESINQGVSFVSYRGFADIHGWHYPDFRIESIDLLSNVNMTPIVTSIVCRTGDYCNAIQNPGFGEKWMVIGTYLSPKGAVAFIGASDLNTNTKFNNPLAAGFYTGVFDEQLPHIGQSLLRGKMELYNGFPTEHDYGEYCEFYFHVYNLLGDPELDVRTTVPITLDADYPTSVPVGASYVEVTTRLEGGGVLPNCRVTLLKDSETHVTALSDESGTVILPVSLETTGDLILTVYKHNSVPCVDTINVITETAYAGLYSVSYVSGGDEVVSPGELATVTVTLKNTGTQSLSGITAALSTTDTLIEITSPSTTYGTIAIGGTEQGSFTFLVDEGATHNHQAQMTLTVNATGQGPWTHNFWVPIWSSFLSVAEVVVDIGGNGILDPGETNVDISFTLANEGVIDAEDFHIELSSWSDAITFPTTVANYPSIPVNQSASNSNALTISAAAGVTPGHLANLELAVVEAGDVVEVMRTAITIGDPDTTDPLGPDHYGYYAYDSGDQGYDEAPDYNWIELDPAHGGTGATPLLLVDDASTVVGLPFTFTYYGQEFNEITICSNGWISFGETWMANFRNWHLPSALGPPNLVAGFWDDIRGHPVHPDTLEPLPREVWTRDDGDQFVIEWSDWYNLYGYSTAEFYEATFEIILVDPDASPTVTGDGEIIVQYGTIENVDTDNNYATVGIENQHHTQGLEYTYANIYPPSCSRLRSGLAIKFTTDPPDGFTGVEDRPQPVPNRIALLPGYPNPFNSQATFPLELSQREHVEIAIYNVMGQKVRSLRNQVMDAGRYRIAWDAGALPSGIYFVAMEAGAVHQVQKIVLLK